MHVGKEGLEKQRLIFNRVYLALDDSEDRLSCVIFTFSFVTVLLGINSWGKQISYKLSDRLLGVFGKRKLDLVQVI